MRHRVQGRKLGLPSDQRMALLKNQVRQLLEHGHIITTETRAKEVRRIADRMITRGKQNTLHARRMARRVVAPNVPHGEDYVYRLFHEIAPRFADRPGGYTRIIHLGFRRGDAAPMVKLELALD
jgi:large subunit ribosomal protein L17